MLVVASTFSVDDDGKRFNLLKVLSERIVIRYANVCVRKAVDVEALSCVIQKVSDYGGVKASGTIKLTGNMLDGDKFTVGATQFTAGVDFAVGATILETLDNIVTAINGSGEPVTAYRKGIYRVIVEANTAGSAGNTIIFTEDLDQGDNFELSGTGTLEGGADETVTNLYTITIDSSYTDGEGLAMSIVKYLNRFDWLAISVSKGANTTTGEVEIRLYGELW